MYIVEIIIIITIAKDEEFVCMWWQVGGKDGGVYIMLIMWYIHYSISMLLNYNQFQDIFGERHVDAPNEV